ncbi:serine acetyltransferase [Sulfurovum sp. NBC37-1]|uniref:serine acetyltransferase n=1 Tax=Sulfurovum sp. (strain NBC37-1) TaxID=387093 RepID=UPI0001587B6E|nr:serine acetyltransferase [Sulfurovum sp. NBC37-1]BAF72499.1 acetyltransferase [Sulfurovum sp. NBC37-1]
MIKTYRQLKYYWYADEIRNFGRKRKLYFKLRDLRYRLLFLLRACNHLYNKKKSNILMKGIRKIVCYLYARTQLKLGCEIDPKTDIKEGLFLPHPNGIIIHHKAKIGKNCTILQQVTIGNNANKGLEDIASIGMNVSIGAGAKIIGACEIGNNIIIGANAVVVKNIHDNSVVGGVPARYISDNVPPAYNAYYE